MTSIASLRDAISAAIATALAWLVIGLFTALVCLGTLIAVPFVMAYLLLQKLAPGIFGHPGGVSPDAVEAFDAVWHDLVAGDIAALERHADAREDFPHGQDPFIERHWLTNAVDSGSLASVRWMLERGVDPNFQDDEGYSPLISAVSDDNENACELVALLIDHGADPNFRVTLDRTALHTAACQGAPEVVQLLLERGADPHAYDTDYVPSRPIDDARRLRKRRANVEVLEAWMSAHPKPGTE